MQKKQYEKNAKITVKSLAHFRRTGHNMGANEKKAGNADHHSDFLSIAKFYYLCRKFAIQTTDLRNFRKFF